MGHRGGHAHEAGGACVPRRVRASELPCPTSFLHAASSKQSGRGRSFRFSPRLRLPPAPPSPLSVSPRAHGAAQRSAALASSGCSRGAGARRGAARRGARAHAPRSARAPKSEHFTMSKRESVASCDMRLVCRGPLQWPEDPMTMGAAPPNSDPAVARRRAAPPSAELRRSLFSWSCAQKVMVLSSCELEYYGMIKSAFESPGLSVLFQDLVGPMLMKIRADAAVAHGIFLRCGFGG